MRNSIKSYFDYTVRIFKAAHALGNFICRQILASGRGQKTWKYTFKREKKVIAHSADC